MAGIESRDFTQGLVSEGNVGDSLIPVGACVELKNFEVNSGEIRTPELLDILVTLPLNENGTGYLRDDIGGGHIISTELNLYYYRPDLGLITIRANAFTGQGRPSMVRLNDNVFVCDGFINPFCVNISDVSNFTFPTMSVQGSLVGEWPIAHRPIFAYVWERRVNLILKNKNELWRSWLDNARDFTISASLAADSGNIYISDSKENTFKSIITAFETLFIFKKEGVSLLKNINPGNLSAGNYFFIEGYNTITTHGPFSTAVVLDKLYSLGDFGLQELSVESITNRLKLRTVISTIRNYLRDSLRRETLWCTMIGADEVPSLRVNLQSIGERSVVNIKIDTERLDRDFTYFDLRLLGKAIDGNTNRTRFVIASSGKLWFTDGTHAYPGPLNSVFKSPNHAINRGSFAKGRRFKISGKGLGRVDLSYTWDQQPLASDELRLYGEDLPVSMFETAIYEESVYGPDSGNQFTHNVNTQPLYGSGYELGFTFRIAETTPDVSIETVSFEAQSFGAKPNV